MRYQDLLSSTADRVSEAEAPYALFTERHLQVMWLEQKYFRSPSLTSGEQVKVISPGIWNEESGPDFLKAEIEVSGRRQKGAIELHLRPELWSAHGHHLDPRYDDVILHVALWPGSGGDRVQTSRGQTPPLVILDEQLTIPLHRIVSLIDLDLYPYRKFTGSGACSRKLFSFLGPDRIRDLFQSAASYRRSTKATRLLALENSPAAQLSLGLAQALGYKHNSGAFAQLYFWLKTQLHRETKELEALALGTCGYFSKRYQKKWEDSAQYQELTELWSHTQPADCPKLLLRTDHVRPLNHPIRRLIYLVRFLKDEMGEKVWAAAQQLWEAGREGIRDRRGRTVLRQAFIDLLPEYTDPYWQQHYSFESRPQAKDLRLLGETRRVEYLINMLFPVLEHSYFSSDPEACRQLDQLIHSFPHSGSGKTRYIKHRLFGDGSKGKLLSTQQMEQGAFQLHYDFCQHYEASCTGCPFVSRYRQMSKRTGQSEYFYFDKTNESGIRAPLATSRQEPL